MKACRHPKRDRKHVHSCLSVCQLCGMHYAMVPTRSGCTRRWVQPGDPRAEDGQVITETLLEVVRERFR